MYASIEDGIPVVSNIQAYLDLYAGGGRDQKQADYLLEKAIEPMRKAELLLNRRKSNLLVLLTALGPASDEFVLVARS